MVQKELTLIGRNAAVDFIGYVNDVPAKIDTGADSSSVWVSNISVDEAGLLHFCLFGEGSPHYTGKLITREAYAVALVRSASGHEQVRFRSEFSLRLNGRRIRAMLNLSDRSRNKYPVLIGRRTLNGKFAVDVAQAHYEDTPKVVTMGLNEELKKDPHGFYVKYYGKNVG